MAYRLKLKEPLDDGLRRIADAQITRAIAHMEAAVERTSIHETRKCLKRTRALLRFFRPTIGDTSFKYLNSTLRDIGQSLSERRDTDVMVQTVAGLVQSAGLKPTAAAQLNRAILKSRMNQLGLGWQAHNSQRTISDLLSVREAIDTVVCADAGGTIATSGIARCLDTARETFDAAFEDGEDEALHEWRKAVQIHWRHMQLVSTSWLAFCDARIVEARTISALVGTYRDLSLLSDHITGDQNVVRTSETGALNLKPALQRTVTDLIDAQKKPLRAKAKLHGERLLAEGTKGLCQRLMVYWTAAAELKDVDATMSVFRSID